MAKQTGEDPRRPAAPGMSDGDSQAGLTYAAAGVDVEAGDRFTQGLAPLAATTARPGADPSLGGFGGTFDLAAAGFRDPVLVAGADGVGTKLDIAAAVDHHASVGVDLVAMCVNDVLAHGAEPLFFLDYIATGRLQPEAARQLVEGVARGCREAGCALIGGETAEMPGFYAPGRYDAAGFAVGAAERGDLLPLHDDMRAGDAMIALGSSGAHANGFSFIRATVDRLGLAWDAPSPWDAATPLWRALLEPTRIYVPAILPLARAGRLTGAAHITGGGLIDNPQRALPAHLRPAIDWESWRRPPLFAWLQDAAGAQEAEMRRVFNCGVGFVVYVARDTAEDVVTDLRAAGETAWICGEVVDA